MTNSHSPYSASFTGATMMYSEMNIIVGMLLENNSPDTVKKLKTNAQYLQINSTTGRERVTSELVKRFRAVPVPFWERYITLGEPQQRLALLFVILKTYRLLFEFQADFAIGKYNSVDRTISKNDVLAIMSEIASRDALVDSWTQQTRDKAASNYITTLRQAGLVNELSGELQCPTLADEDYAYYVQIGELWFLQACFLPGYKIEQIKQLAV